MSKFTAPLESSLHKILTHFYKVIRCKGSCVKDVLTVPSLFTIHAVSSLLWKIFNKFDYLVKTVRLETEQFFSVMSKHIRQDESMIALKLKEQFCAVQFYKRAFEEKKHVPLPQLILMIK